MPVLKLRDYQILLSGGIYAAWELYRAVLAVLATGGGKTVTFASLMHDHNGASAAVVHRKEIVGQISLALGKLEVRHRIIAPPDVVTRIRRKHLKELGQSWVDPHALAGVVSVQTLTSRSAGNNAALQSWLSQVTLGVFDEGHHYVKVGQWGRAVGSMSNAKLLFVTASPERADGKGLGHHADGFAETMVEGPSVKWLQDNGYLCRFTYKAPKSDLNMAGIPITATGDLNTKELRKRVVESHLVGDVVAQYLQYLPGKRALVFATDVKTADEIAAAFTQAGVKAVALSGETDPGERDAGVEAFADNRLQVLVNVDLFDEGFDVPGADGVIMARPTESLAKFLQMVGRVLRPVYAKGFDLSTAEGRLAAMVASVKPHAIVIDPVRNWERHGMPNWPRQWTLDGKVKQSRGTSDTQTLKVCLGCTQPFHAYLLACPYCGHVNSPGGRASPEQVDGDLHDLDVDAMAALFEKYRRANLSEDEFAMSQFARRVPPIGRAAEINRHRAVMYRREVLKELVAWWAGFQGERNTREVQKRFYLRFGVDIMSAFTLPLADTDALIDKITRHFDEDLR